jgi:hypothetical protein
MAMGLYSPIPITVPYSLFFPASCADAGGHKQISAKRARKRREREEAILRDLARDGRRSGLVIAVDDTENRERSGSGSLVKRKQSVR